MAIEKNITMKQFNGTDYDTLYPKTIASQIPDVYSKTDTITTETLSQLGLSTDKLPNDAFQQIKTLIDNAQASADGKARIQTGSYVGTGTYGADNPCSLTFDFEPYFIYITEPNPTTNNSYASFTFLLAYRGQTNAYTVFGTGVNSSSTTSISFEEKSIIWNYGWNTTGTTYYYICIG